MAHMPVAERRAQLIAATSRVIGREGVAGASTRRIAEEAGVPLGLLHYSFGTKEELFVAVIDDAVDRTYQLIAERAAAPGSGLGRAVTDYLETFRHWALAAPEAMVTQYALLTWMLRTQDGHAEAGRRAYRRYIDGLRPVLAAAATERERDVDLHKLARLAVATADGLILQLITIGPEAVGAAELPEIADGLVHGARPGFDRNGTGIEGNA